MLPEVFLLITVLDHPRLAALEIDDTARGVWKLGADVLGDAFGMELARILALEGLFVGRHLGKLRLRSRARGSKEPC